MNLVCVCGNSFANRNGLSNHKRTCKAHKALKKHVQTLPPLLGIQRRRFANEEPSEGDDHLPPPLKLRRRTCDGAERFSVEETVALDLQVQLQYFSMRF